jgi:hypothetical protein
MLVSTIANVIPGSTDLNNHWHLDLYGMVPFWFCTCLVLVPGVDLSISFSLLKSRDLMLEGIKLYLQSSKMAGKSALFQPRVSRGRYFVTASAYPESNVVTLTGDHIGFVRISPRWR